MAQNPPSMPAECAPAEKLMTPANIVTLVRICLVPVFVLVLLSPWPGWVGLKGLSDQAKSLVAAGVFILISCTDWIDGYLARSRGEVTDFGKFVDPLADKILVAAALLALVELSVLPSWPVLVILAREFIVSGVRMIAASKGQVIAASWYGKAKTVFQIVAIVLFLVKDSLELPTFSSVLGNPLYLLSWLVMTIALVLTVVSMLDYLAKARPLLGLSSGKSGRGAEGQGGEAERAQVVCGAKHNQEARDAEREQAVPAAKCEQAASSAEHEEHEQAMPGAEQPRAQHAATCASGVDPYEGLGAQELHEMVARKAAEVVGTCAQRNDLLATAESLTGGMIAAALTGVAGSSAIVRGGVVSYASEVKHRVLAVDADNLRNDGAVNEQTASEMAHGARALLEASAAVAVTGIAGPTGAEPGKPVGTVWIAVESARAHCAKRFVFQGNRELVRLKTVCAALELLEHEVLC